MAFQQKEWKSGDTLSHVELNRIEDGILQNSQIEIPDSVALKSELDAVSEKVTTAEGKLTDLTNTVTSLSSKDTEIEQSLNEYKSEKIKIGDIVWGEGLVGYFPNDTTGATYEIPNSEDGLKHIVCDEVHIWD